MRAPTPIEISESITDVFMKMDNDLSSRSMSKRGSALNLNSKALTVSAASTIGFIATATVIAAAPAVTIGLVAAAGVAAIGSLVIGQADKIKNNRQKTALKKEVLQRQYGIDDKDDLKHFSKLNDHDFSMRFAAAAYTPEVEKAITASPKITVKLMNAIDAIRNKYGAKKDTGLTHKM